MRNCVSLQSQGLLRTTSSMTSGPQVYKALQDLDSTSDEQDVYDYNPKPRRRFLGLEWSRYGGVGIFVVSLLLSNVCTALIVAHMSKNQTAGVNVSASSNVSAVEKQAEQVYPIIDELPTRYTRFKWWTAWGLEAGATNDTNLPSAHVADELWEGILPSHGMVAVDREWAKERNWPESMYLPKDEHGKEKGVYLLEAYHLLHCLQIIRLSFVEARRGLPLTWPVGHTTHCFDIMRQSIQCNADNTPLYTFGDMTAGNGQLRKCKDWDALRDWATQHTACYRDSVKPIPLRDHFGFCQEGIPYQRGKDGLPSPDEP